MVKPRALPPAHVALLRSARFHGRFEMRACLWPLARCGNKRPVASKMFIHPPSPMRTASHPPHLSSRVSKYLETKQLHRSLSTGTTQLKINSGIETVSRGLQRPRTSASRLSNEGSCSVARTWRSLPSRSVVEAASPEISLAGHAATSAAQRKHNAHSPIFEIGSSNRTELSSPPIPFLPLSAAGPIYSFVDKVQSPLNAA